MDDTRPARAAAQDDPGMNHQFRRTWSGDLVTGPDVPETPAHPYVWHSPSTLARDRAEAAFRRVAGGVR